MRQPHRSKMQGNSSPAEVPLQPVPASPVPVSEGTLSPIQPAPPSDPPGMHNPPGTHPRSHQLQTAQPRTPSFTAWMHISRRR